MARYARIKPKRLTQKLLQIRIGLGLSQNQMIGLLKLQDSLTQAELSAFELGKRVPPLVVLLRYARSVDIHVEDLIDDDIVL